MSLLEFYGNAINDAGYFWPGSAASGYAHRSGSAYGTPWAVPNSSSYIRLFPFGGKAHIFHGIAWTAAAYSSWITFCGDGGGTQHLTVLMASSGLYLYRGNNAGTQLGSYLFTPVAGAWYYVEVEATISDTIGVAKVRLNGVEVISSTGDTKNAGTASTVDAVLYGQGGNLSTAFCDYYLCDDAGSAPYNTYLGDIRVTKHRPSGNGTNAQFTPDTGVNYARVNEFPVSAANYVSSATSGHKDSYAMDDLPNNVGSVLAVKAGLFAKNIDGGSPALKPLVRTGGVDYVGAAYNLGGSDLPFTHTWNTNPNTGVAWTAAEVNALEAGMVRV